MSHLPNNLPGEEGPRVGAEEIKASDGGQGGLGSGAGHEKEGSSPTNHSESEEAFKGRFTGLLRVSSSRELMLAWCLWLMGSWGVTLLKESVVAGVRWMVFSGFAGLMLLWPAVRLSQSMEGRCDTGLTRAARPGDQLNLFGEEGLLGAGGVEGQNELTGVSVVRSRAILWGVFQDWFWLNLVFQVVLWPLRVTSLWSVEQTVWLVGALAAWSLLVSCLVAWGSLREWGWARMWTMAACVALVLGEPVLMGLLSVMSRGGMIWGGVVYGGMRVSPIEAIWAMTEPPGDWVLRPWGGRIVGVAVFAVIGWGSLVFGCRGRASR